MSVLLCGSWCGLGGLVLHGACRRCEALEHLLAVVDVVEALVIGGWFEVGFGFTLVAMPFRRR